MKFAELTQAAPGESSAAIRSRVIAARERQQARFAGRKISCNARMATRELKEFVPLDGTTLAMLKNAMTELNLSARAYDRILKVARTIADLAGRDVVDHEAVFEAIQYRSLDRQIWG